MPTSYTVPVDANISFANFSISKGMSPFVPLRGESITPIIRLQPAGYLTITVLPQLSFSEQFGDFWNTFGGVIGLVGRGFAAGLSALALDKLHKKK